MCHDGSGYESRGYREITNSSHALHWDVLTIIFVLLQSVVQSVRYQMMQRAAHYDCAILCLFLQ